MATSKKMRKEKDYLGEVEVPAAAYYGVQTQRAVRNYPISGLRVSPFLVRAAGCIKKAAAQTNGAAGRLPPKVAAAIAEAADDVISLKLLDQFVVDAFQSGAGVSFHMNVNEVVANRAIEILGGWRGDYSLVHPNDHVNLGQSTNDVVPTSMRLAALMLLREAEPVFREAVSALRAKAGEFGSIVKAGRTHMMDAVPLTLGQEFGGYASAIERGANAVQESSKHLRALGIGASAVGTGVNTFGGYREEVVRRLSELTELELQPAPDLFEATQSLAPFAILSGALKALALECIRIGNDFRLLNSGPVTGFGEIRLPALQPGSSIMPGKVNPVMPEMLAMVGFQVVGNDAAISLAVQAGQLELNVMMPLVAHNLLQSLQILPNALSAFTTKCVAGVVADAERCRSYAESTPALATILDTVCGYQKAAEIVKRSAAGGKSIREVALELGYVTREQADKLLSPEALLRPESEHPARRA
jgi:aspartate ammonia-lyase